MRRGRHRRRWWPRLRGQQAEPDPEEAEDEDWPQDEWPFELALMNRQTRRQLPLALLPVSTELIPYRRHPYPGSPQ